MVFLALGGAIVISISRGAHDHLWRKPVFITHGVGLLLSLVGGFGLLARIGVMHGAFPGWVIAKIGIWIFFAATAGVVMRWAASAKPLWVVAILLGGAAAFLAGYKPF